MLVRNHPACIEDSIVQFASLSLLPPSPQKVRSRSSALPYSFKLIQRWLINSSLIQYYIKMGCGSSVAQVSDSVKEGLFRPIRMLDFEKEGESEVEGKVYLLGETRTQRKIIELDFLGDASQVLSCRVRIPVPRIHYDPVQLMYEESQEVFHLGIYGLSVVPPFNRMLALCLQDTLIFLCGGKDFDNYNIKSDCFYYSLAEARKPAVPNEERTEPRNKYAGNRFQKVSSMGTKRYGHAGVYLQKQKSLIVVGGINQKGEIVSSCERYAIMDNIWRDIPPMHVPRAFANCLQYGNKVYVFGGRSSPSKRSKKIEVFDCETHQWTILNYKLHRGIEDSLVFSQKSNEILIIGGKTNFGPTCTVLRLDLLSQTYVWDSDLHYEYQASKGVKTRQSIIVFGGSKEAIEEYRNGQWTSKPFEVKKYFQLEDIESFTCTAQSLQATATEKKNDISPQQKQDLIIFGNDDHPCLLSASFKGNTACLKKNSLSMKFKQRSKMSIVQYQIGKYFLAGGCDSKGKKSFNSAYFYNSNTYEFQETVKMVQKKHNFAICALQGFIYTFGGFDNMDKLAKKTCSKFNIANESWDSLPTLRRARNNCVAVCIGNSKIAIFGGTKGDQEVAGIEIFYPPQRKFDIFQPDLHIPSTILSAYSDNSSNDRIIILNKNPENYEITNISLTYPPPSSNRSSVSQNRETIDLSSFVNQQTSTFKKSEPQQLPKKKEQNADTNVIRIKPAMVQIHPKKLQSQSSQMQLQNDYDDIDQSFEMEKIDLKKNKVDKLKTQEVEQHQEVRLKTSSKENELKIEVQQPIVIQSEIPKIEPIAQEPKIVEKKVEEPQEEVRTIWALPLAWLPNADYLVVQRIEHTYFLTDNLCIEFHKKAGQVREMKVENTSGLSLDMIK